MLLFHGYAAITLKMFCLPYSYTLFLTNKTTKLILSNKAVRNISDCVSAKTLHDQRIVKTIGDLQSFV